MRLAPDSLSFEHHGAQRFPGALDSSALVQIDAVVGGRLNAQPGLRLHAIEGLAGLIGLASAPGRIATAMLGRQGRPVRAVLFDKTPELNWPLGWHQDRTIVVEKKVDAPGFGPWSVKQGLQHVEPPFAVIEGMATLRIHLDAVDAENAPLLVAPGSHRLGRVPIGEIEDVVARCGADACLADPGDIWAYATPILHASEAARRPGRRRVLQVDYAASDLPPPLLWLGV